MTALEALERVQRRLGAMKGSRTREAKRLLSDHQSLPRPPHVQECLSDFRIERAALDEASQMVGEEIRKMRGLGEGS